MSSQVKRFRNSSAVARLARLALLSLVLSGCAGPMAYREGRDLVARDQAEAGLLKFQQAMAAEPTNAQYRASYLEARDGAIVRHIEQAERALAAGQSGPATRSWQRALALDGKNERALAGLRKLEANARLDQLCDSAAAALDQHQEELARRRLDAVLVERPDHPRALAMLRALPDKNPALAPESAMALAFRQPITLEFRDATLKQVFEVVARHSGLNFAFDKDVKTDTKVSVFLKDGTVEAAVYLLLMTNQLEQQVVDNKTVLLYPNNAAKQKEYQATVVKTFYIANADAKALAATLKAILKTRDVAVDDKLNLLIVRDTPEAVRLAERLIALQDVAEPEVMLDVEILEIKRSRLLELGIAWPASLSLSPLSLDGGVAVTLADLQTLNRSTIGISELKATIKASKTDGDTNILANPRIRVRNKEKAKIVIGDKLPVVTSIVSAGVGGFATDSISYVDVGLTLNAEPTIYLNNEVAIRISLEVSSLVSQVQTKNGTTAYQIGTRQAATMLQLKDGENQVLAGLINNEDRKTASKVPALGDIPLLGRLFGSTADDNSKTEIVLSITPHLIRNLQRAPAQLAEFEAGTEMSQRRRPPATAPTAEAPAAVAPAAPPASAPVTVPAAAAPPAAATAGAPT